MNTFLAYPEYRPSAKVLDMKRLGKQRVEVLQLVNAILDPKLKGWQNHPCTSMWRPWLPALVEYGIVICEEWCSRGYSDTVRFELLPLRKEAFKLPPWLGSPGLHSSHRANLLRKDPVHYGKFGWTEKPLDGYFWPHPHYYWRAYEPESGSHRLG
jgi:hypothetical protein